MTEYAGREKEIERRWKEDDWEGLTIDRMREDIPYLLAQLREAREKLAAVEEMRTERAARFSKDDEWWIRGLDRILKGGD